MAISAIRYLQYNQGYIHKAYRVEVHHQENSLGRRRSAPVRTSVLIARKKLDPESF